MEKQTTKNELEGDLLSLLKKEGLKEKELSPFTVVKRNGSIVPFRRERIYRAIRGAFVETKVGSSAEEVEKMVEESTNLVVAQLISMASKGTSLVVEGIQDIVEVTLMQNGHHDVARNYIIHRDNHKKLREDSPLNLKIQRSDGMMVRFNPMKIASSLEAAFCGSYQIETNLTEDQIDAINRLTQRVMLRAAEAVKKGTILTSSFIQDEIENALMSEGYFPAAKDYILQRAKQKEEPSFILEERRPEEKEREFVVVKGDGTTLSLRESQLLKKLQFACKGLENVSAEELCALTIANFYEGIKEHEVDFATIFAARSKIELEPAYAKVAARLLLDVTYRETMGVPFSHLNLKEIHRNYFKEYLSLGVEVKRISPELLTFDLDLLSQSLKLERDDLFSYLGLQTLYDRYFIHHDQKRLETPQIFWMRVAMGLAIGEKENKTQRAIEFYDLLSDLYFVSATPTLFNSGTLHSQLSSCYLSTVYDDLSHIFKVISDDAQLSKWAGGIGNDWTNVRATGAHIKGTNGKSQGIIPFLKVANDVAVAVNQGGKRKGAICAYLETWHLDLEDFLELRKNTGDERRRTHDMHTANWIPDLFMKRLISGGKWTLFSPNDVSDLHDLYGEAFEKRYQEYEALADQGKLKLFKRVEALDLWRKMISMLFETGHPWITFKDPSNIRSSQDHVGVVHNSNLCTEILLNTSDKETAVCNLGSINLVKHITENGLDQKRLEKTIKTAVRMLDNVIDINFYPTEEARKANLVHRPIGLGIMGFQDALYQQEISYASHEAVAFADKSMEIISYYAILASAELAKERGAYQSYAGSKWSKGLLPIDTIDLLERERGMALEMDRSSHLDWSVVRESVKRYGMRNSNTMAIAPTATIANIAGVSASIEPAYKHLFVKSNLSGDFTVANSYLIDKLKSLGLWDFDMVDDLKYFDGCIAEIERIPQEVKQLFLTSFEIEPDWILECASRRQKWIDMGQSLNLYMSEPSGKKLSNMYLLAWKKGLKTTYYCRTLAATQIEKSTTDINKRGLQPRWMKNASASSNIKVDRPEKKKTPGTCTLGEECESCQ